MHRVQAFRILFLRLDRCLRVIGCFGCLDAGTDSSVDTLAIAARRVCDYMQGACLHLWVLVQGGNGATRLSNELMGAGQSREGFDMVVGNIRPLAKASAEAHWRHLVDNPEEWWDNRAIRKNPRAPDFKHKVTRQALWINNWQTPEWVRARFER